MTSTREQIRKELKNSRTKRKKQRIELIKQAKKQLVARKLNPNATAITKEINRLAEKNPAIEKLSFAQVYKTAKEKHIKLPGHNTNKKQLILRIKEITVKLEKPTLHKVVNKLNKSEDFPHWNYGNLWHYLNDHNISVKSLGIVAGRSGHQAFLKDLIKAAREIKKETKSVQIPIVKLREKLGLKPAAFANRIKRLNKHLEKKSERNLEAKLAKLGLFIARNQKEKKISPKKPATSIILSPKEITDKIDEIELWIEELRKFEVKKNTDIDKEETVLLLRTMFKELKEKAEQSKTLKNLEGKFHRVINSKKNEITKLKKQVRKKQKQLNREIDLKHYDGSIADKLLDLIGERKKENKQLIATLLDRIWRRSMNGGILVGKDFEAIEAAKNFLREVQSKTS